MPQSPKFPELNLPDLDQALTAKEGKVYIFDIIRRKSVICTPEEWVRQHFIHFLIHHKSYPKGLITIEKGLTYNNLEKRSDIVVYDRSGKVFLLVECKAPGVKIKNEAFYQASSYNARLRAKYIIITNGLNHFCCSADYETGQLKSIDSIPEFGN